MAGGGLGWGGEGGVCPLRRQAGSDIQLIVFSAPHVRLSIKKAVQRTFFGGSLLPCPPWTLSLPIAST